MPSPLRLLAALALAGRVHAADAVVTLQYQSKTAVFAAGTSRLEPATVKAIHDAFPTAKNHTVNAFSGQIGKLSADEIAKNFEDARAALQALNNGALLVLNCHSSIEKVGVPAADGTTLLIPWSRFWEHFGIARPPRLALVCLNGCVGKADDSGVKGEAGDWDLELLRCSLSAQALVSGKRNIATAEAQADLTNVMTKMRADLKGWDLDLSADKGAFSVMHVLAIRTGRLYGQKELTFNKLKLQAVTFARAGRVVQDGPRDVVFAHEDDADSTRLAESAVPVAWDEHDERATRGPRPFCFEFKPRGEIVRIEVELEVEAFGSDPAEDGAYLWAGEEPVVLARDFSAFMKKAGKVSRSFPSAEQLQEKPGLTLKESHPELYRRVSSGRVRGAIADRAWLRGAALSVTYPEAK
ncbi:MAG: hypothetical protein IT452_17720 [Planctomycetia bacterium]|nr:hypothetical protein [Planctomycetia bacterium]